MQQYTNGTELGVVVSIAMVDMSQELVASAIQRHFDISSVIFIRHLVRDVGATWLPDVVQKNLKSLTLRKPCMDKYACCMLAVFAGRVRMVAKILSQWLELNVILADSARFTPQRSSFVKGRAKQLETCIILSLYSFNNNSRKRKS